MSAKLRKALIKLAGFRGSNEEEFKELSHGLSTGTIGAFLASSARGRRRLDG